MAPLIEPKLRRRYVYMSDQDWAWLKAEARSREVTISALLRSLTKIMRDRIEGDR